MLAPPPCRSSGPHSEPDSTLGLQQRLGEGLSFELKGAAVAFPFHTCPASPSSIVWDGCVTSASATPGAFLIVKDKDGKEVGTTKNDVTDPGASNTGSFFLPPGTYTVEAGETDMFAAGLPTPFEIKTAQVLPDLLVTVGKAK